MRIWDTVKDTYTQDDIDLAIIRSILDYKSQFKTRSVRRDLNRKLRDREFDSRRVSSYLKNLVNGDLKGLIEIDRSSGTMVYIIKDKVGIKKVYDRLYERNAQEKK